MPSQLPIDSGHSETGLQNSVKADVRGSRLILFFRKILYLVGGGGVLCAKEERLRRSGVDVDGSYL